MSATDRAERTRQSSDPADCASRLQTLALELSRNNDIAAASGVVVREARAVVRVCQAVVLHARRRARAVTGIRKRAAQRLRAESDTKRTYLESLLRSTPVPTVVCRGPDHVLELWNPAWERMHPHRAMKGKKVREAFPELDGQELVLAMDRAYRTGDPVTFPEKPVRLDPDGGGVFQAAYFNMMIQPIKSPRGWVTGLIVIGVDVTPQVRARQAIERELAAHEESERIKDEFLAVLGHELRNPLAPIKIALQLIKQRGETSAVEEHEIMERHLDHLVRLADDLLDTARIARGGIELRSEPLDIADVVTAAVEMVGPLLEARRHRLELYRFGSHLPVLGDRTRLAQVVANLLTNAAKFTDPGGRVEISMAVERDAVVVVRVKDNGRGIMAGLLPRVFDPFVQGPRPAAGAPNGLGIGLSLARNLIELHGGSLSASSEGAGKGSEFVLRLPAARHEPACGVPSRIASEPLGLSAQVVRRRVLVVDDNTDAAELLARALRAAGHTVAVAYDGPDALVRALELRPQVALVDIDLPVMDGYELSSRLRRLPGLDHLRIVALTGYSQGQQCDAVARAAFDQHLVKPTDLRTILRSVADDCAACA